MMRVSEWMRELKVWYQQLTGNIEGPGKERMKFIWGDRIHARYSAPLQQHRHCLSVVSRKRGRGGDISCQKTRGGTGLTAPVSCGSIWSQTAENEAVTSPQPQLSVLPPSITLSGKQGHTRHPGTSGIWQKYLQATASPHSYTQESEAICSWIHHLVLDLCVSTYRIDICVFVSFTFGGSATPWPEVTSLSPPRKKPRVYLAGQRCRRGSQWVPLCSGWRGGRRPLHCRTSPCRHHRSCTRARSACPCCSARDGRCRWWGWGGKRCSAHAAWSQSALSKSMPCCLRVESKRTVELTCRANAFSREWR